MKSLDVLVWLVLGLSVMCLVRAAPAQPPEDRTEVPLNVVPLPARLFERQLQIIQRHRSDEEVAAAYQILHLLNSATETDDARERAARFRSFVISQVVATPQSRQAWEQLLKLESPEKAFEECVIQLESAENPDSSIQTQRHVLFAGATLVANRTGQQDAELQFVLDTVIELEPQQPKDVSIAIGKLLVTFLGQDHAASKQAAGDLLAALETWKPVSYRIVVSQPRHVIAATRNMASRLGITSPRSVQPSSRKRKFRTGLPDQFDVRPSPGAAGATGAVGLPERRD